MRFHTYTKFSPELADAIDLQALLDKLADFPPPIGGSREAEGRIRTTTRASKSPPIAPWMR